MRDLTREQKKLLDIWYNEQESQGRKLSPCWDIEKDWSFTGELFEEIDNINPCEIITQNINQYITSKIK